MAILLCLLIVWPLRGTFALRPSAQVQTKMAALAQQLGFRAVEYLDRARPLTAQARQFIAHAQQLIAQAKQQIAISQGPQQYARFQELMTQSNTLMNQGLRLINESNRLVTQATQMAFRAHAMTLQAQMNVIDPHAVTIEYVEPYQIPPTVYDDVEQDEILSSLYSVRYTVEQREEAVAQVAEGLTYSQVARNLGPDCSPSTSRRWVREHQRHLGEGPELEED